MANRIVDILTSYIRPSPQDTAALEKEFSDLMSTLRPSNQSMNNRGSTRNVGSGNVSIGLTDGVVLFNPNTGKRSVRLDPDGDAFFGKDIDAFSDTSLVIFSNAQKYNAENMGEGDLLVGDNSANKANMLWDRSTGQLKFRTGKTVHVYIDVDGSIFADLANIGGWNIDATRIYSDSSEIVLDSANTRIEVGASDEILIDGNLATITVGVGASKITIDGGNELIKTANFSSGLAGWQIKSDGTAEFQNIIARGEIHSSVFVKNLIDARAGSMIIATSAGVLTEDVTINSGVPFNITINDPPGGAAFLFGTGSESLQFKAVTASGVVETWVTTSARFDNGDGTQTYTVSYASGNTTATYTAGTPIISHGNSGDGHLFLTADDSNGPHLSVRTWPSAPWTGFDERVRIGNLNGYLGYTSDLYGIGMGSSASSNANMSWDATNGLRLRNGTTTKIQFTNSGSANITGDLNMGAGGTIRTGSGTTRIELTNSKLAGYNSSVLQFYIDATDGKGYFGAGNVVLDVNGMSILDASSGAARQIKWYDLSSGDKMGDVFGDWGGSGPAVTWLRALTDDGYSWSEATVILAATDFGTGGNDVRLSVGTSGNIDTTGVTYMRLNSGASLRVGGSGDPNVALDVTGDAVISGGLRVDASATSAVDGEAWASQFSTPYVQAIADDSVYTITPPYSNGLVIVYFRSGTGGNDRGIFQYRLSGSPFVQEITTRGKINLTTGALTGTTGSDAASTLSADGTSLYFENRLGGAGTWGFVFMGR